MPERAMRHFGEDIARAGALVNLADTLASGTQQERLLRDDVLRSAWMFAIGAMDAYFSDAYADLLGSTLICLRRQPLDANGNDVRVPDGILRTPLPASMFMRDYPNRENWRWRMGARGRIERQNFLSLEDEVRKLLNPFMRNRRGLFTSDSMESWIVDSGNRKSLLGISASEYAHLATPQLKGKARKDARDRLMKRAKELVQRRHDCIHNCDRPKNAPQTVGSVGTVRRVIDHVSYVVNKCDEHIVAEYPPFLAKCGFSGTTMNGVGY